MNVLLAVVNVYWVTIESVDHHRICSGRDQPMTSVEKEGLGPGCKSSDRQFAACVFVSSRTILPTSMVILRLCRHDFHRRDPVSIRVRVVLNARPMNGSTQHQALPALPYLSLLNP